METGLVAAGLVDGDEVKTDATGFRVVGTFPGDLRNREASLTGPDKETSFEFGLHFTVGVVGAIGSLGFLR